MSYRKKYFYHIYVFVLVLIIGLIIGLFVATNYAANAADTFRLGLVESNITISNVKWKDFWGWRNISCGVDGRISVNIPKDTDIVFNDLQNPDCIREINREHRVYSDGNELLYYDFVTYEIENGDIAAAGILKNRDNAITAAACGYKAGFTYGDGSECMLGYIPPGSETFEEWSVQQAHYASMDLTPYLGAFNISRTYDYFTALHSKTGNENVRLIKKDGKLLDCIIENNGISDWSYHVERPVLEMWYCGVWIELDTDIAYASDDVCHGMSSKEIDIPDSVTDTYPYLFSGLYRLVLYGTKGDYATSDVFVIEGTSTYSVDVPLL